MNPGNTNRRDIHKSRVYPNANGGAMSQEFVTKQNDDITRELASQVSRIKELSIHIDEEVKRNILAGEELDSKSNMVQEMLRASMKRLQMLRETASSRHMIFVAIFVFCIFVFLWLLAKF